MYTGIGVVNTGDGKVKGVRKQSYTVFRGIPYAKPPVGDLRWRRPQPPEPRDGVLEAKSFPPTAMQRDQEPGSFYNIEFFSDEDYMPPMSEDCLYLNIWTPAQTGAEKLPVAFWIHGGAFHAGFGSEMEFDGEAFCKRGVILVTINYRLGALGFLAHKWLSEESLAAGENGFCGNYGLFDQLEALKWVHENISAFGGDPSRITVFGQSAGAMSVQALVSAKLSAGLINGAILQSGGGYKSELLRDFSAESAFGLGEAFSAACGAASLKDLRAIPAGEVISMANKVLADISSGGAHKMFGPIIDGFMLTKPYNEALEEGDHPDIPYMLGSCMHDFGIPDEAVARGEKNMLYKGCMGWALLSERLGRKPNYAYYFTRVLAGDGAGAFHSAELWYIFGTLSRSWRPKTGADYDLSNRISDYWCNFIKTGDPNGAGSAAWRPCVAGDEYVHELK
jgi:para-nitrobenzyl esterase